VRSHRPYAGLAAGALLAATLVVGAPADGSTAGSAAPSRAARPSGAATTYVVLADAGHEADAERAVVREGGTVVGRNPSIGALTVDAPADGFLAAVADDAGVAGAARSRPVGTAPGTAPNRDLVEQAERGHGGRAPARSRGRHRPGGPGGVPAGTDTFEALQWDMQMIHADVARTVNAGSPQVLVGIIDTGIDASQPDLAPNFDAGRSRNFTTDIPEIDGPCEVPSCVDPANTDQGGHGTHVAGTVAAAANGVGIVGVAPRVKLVNVRAGQDSGYFFLAPTLDALTYAADAGIDVVNMSFYVDPWLYNCRSNPADSPEAQYEQRSIVAAMNRALEHAHRRGVTLVSAMGNENTDLGKPGVDETSPDYPVDTAYPRTIDNDDCLSMPSEGSHVLNVTSLGPSTRKADYSNYGLEQGFVSAPGGWFRDGFGTPSFRTNGNLILSTYPLATLQDEGLVDEDGTIVPEAEGLVLKDCLPSGACGWYTYLQGTSMAAPHVTGVAALVVSRYGERDRRRGGLTLAPDVVARVLARTATPTPCPTPRLQSYAQEGRDASFDALCEGSTRFNGFYGYGIVDAHRAVAGG
jgi:subtilisin family serine protease